MFQSVRKTPMLVTMQFDLTDERSKEEHEHAADGYKYYRLIKELIGELAKHDNSDLYCSTVTKLCHKHGLPRVKALLYE